MRYSGFSASTESSTYDDEEDGQVETGQSSDGKADLGSRLPRDNSFLMSQHHERYEGGVPPHAQASPRRSTPKLLSPRNTASKIPQNRASHAPPPHPSSNPAYLPEPVTPRQRIIQEFITTENAFLTTAQTCVSTFILPLRAQDCKTWIGGVPEDVCRLLDWYEDIVNLHAGIMKGLDGCSSLQGFAGVESISGFAAYLLEFVPKFQVYQPYWVRLEDILEVVGREVRDEKSCFGPFVRMQERSLDGRWTFETLLEEPLHRLTAYLDIFKVRFLVPAFLSGDIVVLCLLDRRLIDFLSP